MLAAIETGTSINNRYQIQRILGQGGFGRTYLAFDTHRFGHPCVLKEFVPAGIAEEVVTKSSQLFEREARALYQINHPQVPKFLACFTEAERLFIVQEYVNGKTYAQLLQERLADGNQAVFSEVELVEWLKDLLPVLQYLHEMNIIHRDISLENIMFSFDQKKPMLIDFGLVKEKVSQIWSIGTVLGKVGYSPPEQLRMGRSYPSSDLYALGVCAIVLLTGKMPDLLIDDSLEWQWHSYVNINESLIGILDKMLAEKPKQRYQSAQEIITELQAIYQFDEGESDQPLKKVQVEIDFVRKESEVAQIVDSDEFKLLEKRANDFRQKIGTPIQPELVAQVQEPSLPSVLPVVSIVPQEPAHAESSSLNTNFLERCRQELTRFVGSLANFLLDRVSTESSEMTPKEVVEALAVEIANPQHVEEFKNNLKSFTEAKTKLNEVPSSTVRVSSSTEEVNEQQILPFVMTQLASSQLDSENQILRSQQTNNDSTQMQQAKISLTHLATNKEFKLPKNKPVIHIGKPNARRDPDIDVSELPNASIVSRNHASIYLRGDGMYLEDSGSSNGTYVNETRLFAGVQRRLQSGDIITLGQANLMAFVFKIS
jgi:serine/threonine protein kinase